MRKLERGNPETRALQAAVDHLNQEAVRDLVALYNHGSPLEYDQRLYHWRGEVADAIERGFQHMQAVVNHLHGLKVEELLRQPQYPLLIYKKQGDDETR